jgi:DNA modification methylase
LNANTGEWDWDSLANEWEAEELTEWGLDVPNFDTDEVLEAEEDDFDTTPPEIPITVLGDLYEIGEHRLLCGDSTCSDTVAKLMDGEKADMVFTDPPYNVDYEGKTKEKLKIQNDKHTISEFRNFINASINNLILFTKRGGSYYVCIPLEVGVTDLFLEKTHLQSVIIWLKNTIVMGRKDYQQKTEPILFLLNQEIEEEKTIEDSYQGIIYGWNFGDRHEYYGGRKQSNVWEFDKPQRNGEHPTMKPILLIAKAINNSSKIEMLILDLFLGSGSTMVAAHQLKRKCYGMELDPKYCDVIVNRMRKLDPTLIIKLNGNLHEPSSTI